MGKRKQCAPQKAGVDKRQCMSWNMMEDAAASKEVIIDDTVDSIAHVETCTKEIAESPVEHERKVFVESHTIPEISSSFEGQSPSYRKADLLDIYKLHKEQCLFSIPLLSGARFKQGTWSCVLAEFRLTFTPSPIFVPLPTEELPNGTLCVLYVSNKGEKNILSYEILEPGNVKSSGKKNSRQRNEITCNDSLRDVKFWLVDTDLSMECLTALRCKSFQVVIDKFEPRKMCVSLKVFATEANLSHLSCPGQAVRCNKQQNQCLVTLLDYFYGISAPDYEDLPYTKKHDIDELYKVIKERHTKCLLDVLPGIQHPHLLPKLRPYQQRAITWMLEKEKNTSIENTTADLHMLYTEFVTQDGQTLYFNKYAGVIVKERPCCIPLPPGGILGDEMGLGKTVEVLACILHNPREELPLPDLLPVYPDHKAERKIKLTSDSDETIIYSDIDQEMLDAMTTGHDQTETIDQSQSQTETINQSQDQIETIDQSQGQTENVNQSQDRTNTINQSDGSDLKKCLSEKVCHKNIDYNTNSSVCKAKDEINCDIAKQKNDFFSVSDSPDVHKAEFECLCGSTGLDGFRKNRKRKHTVQCTKCHLLQHAECVNYDLKDEYRGEFKCPHCHVASDAVPSGATLIISPAAIAHQWAEEILKHVKKEAINVLMYTGVHKQGFIQPRTLAKQDIVITTYETLRKEIDYVDLPHSNSSEGRKLRHAKRFMAIPSPLTSVQWWRICLDEAQMVEHTTTKTAEMALRLSAINRWCVTGTPIQRSIDDLYGLLLFLGVDPYWAHMWWTKLVFTPYCHGLPSNMHDLLTSVLWRTVKSDVLDQINIPEQTDEIHWLTFSPVEEHFYRRQYRDCVRLSMERLSKWTDSNIRLSSLDRHTVSQLLYPLLRMRQACCHPQAVRGEFLPIHKTTMTMEELLESLTKKAKLEAEESHRALVAAINGEAGLYIIHEQFVEAVEKYRDVLRSVEEHKDSMNTDSLQQLHAMCNLHEILVSNPEGVAPTLRDDQLLTQILAGALRDAALEEIDELRDRYMAKAVAYVKSTEDAMLPAQFDVKQLQREFTNVSEWWLEVIQWASDRNMDDTIVLKVRDDLLDNRSPQTNTLIRNCRSAAGLEYAVHRQLSELERAYKAVLEAMRGLEGRPTPDLINKTVECCLRPVHEILKSCPFCRSEELFEMYEAKLFSFVEKGIEGQADHVGYQVNTKRQGTWADSQTEIALRSILAYAKHFRVSDDLIEYGVLHIKLFEAMKKEYKKLRTHWAGIKEYVATFDELDMSTTRLRLRLPQEPVPEIPLLNVLEKSELAQHKLKLASERIVAHGELRKKQGQLLYLTNLAKNQTNHKDGSNPEPCPICQQELGKEWSVMQCGHCYCIECIRILVERASFGRRNFSVKCAVCRQNTHQGEISYVMTSRELQPDDISVKGSHSTKVEAVVRCLMQIQRENPKAKSLVFSTWTDVLSVIATALEDNDVTYKALYSAGKFQENLTSFRLEEDVTTLLLPVHSGANGLNLIEATNVLLVEPILNPAQELQAIGRVHRIGQTQLTHIHRFLIRNTIEQKMSILLESMDKHSVLDKAEESSLTIGDLSSLFVQQVVEDDREGVHSLEEEEGSSPRAEVSNPRAEGSGLGVEDGSSSKAELGSNPRAVLGSNLRTEGSNSRAEGSNLRAEDGSSPGAEEWTSSMAELGSNMGTEGSDPRAEDGSCP